MKFGLAFASNIGTEGNSAVEICKLAEQVGFESVWGGEHVIFPSSIESKYPCTADGKVPATKDTWIPDPLIWLAYVSAAAPGLQTRDMYSDPSAKKSLDTGKEIATLDHLTDGKVRIGINVGWLKEEFEALGVPWERGARTDIC